mmetsp:Transcript_11189/g.17880  ORF Transcript_11189/g.17880 Transcript_11189/m.17880 type:complete len:766 (+) Transcript_11189:3-2300(+)
MVVIGVTLSRSLRDRYLASATLPIPYLILMYLGEVAAGILAVVSGVLAIKFHRHGVDKVTVAMMRCNCLVAILMGVCIFLALRAYYQLTNPNLPSGFEIEEINLDDPQIAQMAKSENWAQKINMSSGTEHIGAWDGDAVLGMMKMYQKLYKKRSSIDGVEGVCLRIYYPEDDYSRGQKWTNSLGEMEPLSRAHGEEKEDMKAAPSMHGETVALVFITICGRFDLTDYVQGCCGSCLSRVLGTNGLFPLLTMRFGLVGFQWPFHSGVFLAHNRRKSPKTAIYTRVLRAVVEWNDRRGRCATLLVPSLETQVEHKAFTASHFLKLPLAPTSIVDLRQCEGMTYKEFMRARLKKGDRRDYEGQFKKRQGSIHIDQIFDKGGLGPGYAGKMYKLWSNIASFRTGRGEMPTLVRASPDLFKAVAEDLPEAFRRCFALTISEETPAATPTATDAVPSKLETKDHKTGMGSTTNSSSINTGRSGSIPVASAALFLLGKESGMMTSDIQGLDHELAKARKGYFVMLGRAVRFGLENGYKFVDFGPTTVKPKIDAGSKLIETHGGYHTRSLLLRSMLKLGNDDFKKSQADTVINKRATTPVTASTTTSKNGLGGNHQDKKGETFPAAQARLEKNFMVFCETDFQEWSEDLRMVYGVSQQRPTKLLSAEERKLRKENPGAALESKTNKPKKNRKKKKDKKKKKKKSQKEANLFQAGLFVCITAEGNTSSAEIIRAWVHNKSGENWYRLKRAADGSEVNLPQNALTIDSDDKKSPE